DVGLADDVAVVDAAADDDEIVIHAQFRQRGDVDDGVVAERDGGAAAAGRHHRDVVVLHEADLLDPVGDQQVAVDARDLPVGREPGPGSGLPAIGRVGDGLDGG